MPITFTKVKLTHGWLGNMAPFGMLHDDKLWFSAEALFQALRFNNNSIKEEIRAAKSPMTAKMIAKREKANMVVVPQSEQDLANMEMVLRLKLKQHLPLKQLLLATGDEVIIEDCTNRPTGSGPFWGAVLTDGEWVGENTLGKLWMKIRAEVSHELSQERNKEAQDQPQ